MLVCHCVQEMHYAVITPCSQSLQRWLMPCRVFLGCQTINSSSGIVTLALTLRFDLEYGLNVMHIQTVSTSMSASIIVNITITIIYIYINK